jgi:hypothetical protein
MMNSEKKYIYYRGGSRGGKVNIFSSEFSQVVSARPSVKVRLKARYSVERWRRYYTGRVKIFQYARKENVEHLTLSRLTTYIYDVPHS